MHGLHKQYDARVAINVGLIGVVEEIDQAHSVKVGIGHHERLSRHSEDTADVAAEGGAAQVGSVARFISGSVGQSGDNAPLPDQHADAQRAIGLVFGRRRVDSKCRAGSDEVQGNPVEQRCAPR